MRIALDAMGSDNAPHPEVEGAVMATQDGETEVLLVGDQEILQPAVNRQKSAGKVSIVHASEHVTMNDTPMVAVRKKKDSSLMVAMRQVKEGHADAIVTAGNTGAAMMAARIVIGPIRGVARSAICQVLPTKKKPTTVLDLGANVDCNARHLCEFAEMGVVFSSLNYGVENPRVGLLNIGEEQAKGSEVVKKVHQLLSAAEHINFMGNVEPKHIYNGDADVVICDGFVGNVVLKTSEAVADYMITLVKRELKASMLSQIGALLSKGAYERIKKTVDPNDQPGAPLLGVNGIVIICHGSCEPRGIATALRGARQYVENRLNDHIREKIELLRATEKRLEEQEPPSQEAAG